MSKTELIKKRYPTTRLGKLMRATTLAKVAITIFSFFQIFDYLLCSPYFWPDLVSLSRYLSSVMNLYQETLQSTSLTGIHL